MVKSWSTGARTRVRYVPGVSRKPRGQGARESFYKYVLEVASRHKFKVKSNQ